jgi:Anti-sigma-K factor rskA
MSDTRPQGQPDEAMLDLLIKQVTEGLSPAEQRALDVLDTEVASAYLKDMEHAVAAVTLAGSAGQPPMPAALAARLAQQAGQHFAAPDRVVDLSKARAAAERTQVNAPRGTRRFGNYGWLAAAACLVLAIFVWQRSAPPPVLPAAQVMPPPPVITMAEERAALLAKTDSVKITLGATKDPGSAGMTGDAVWDPVTQRGFLHFAGLAANDPAVLQYQIWIFDAGRDQRYPVDGGVFDVPANSTEVIIPIRATLMVRKLAAFAVTVEKPGGVVVSGREHVVALGATG